MPTVGGRVSVRASGMEYGNGMASNIACLSPTEVLFSVRAWVGRTVFGQAVLVEPYQVSEVNPYQP